MGTGNIMYYVFLFTYTLGPTLVLLWFLAKVRPKFPSALSTTIVVFFAILGVLTVDLILSFAMAPFAHPRPFSIVRGFKISILEETIKIVGAALGIFIAKEESNWADTKLTLAFLSGLVFGIIEGLSYIANFSYSPLGMLILFLSRLTHPVMTVTLMAGLILLAKGRKLAGALIALEPYLVHAFFDYYIAHRSTPTASVILIVELVTFVVGVYILIPIIDGEKKTRSRFTREATVSINDHWLKKM